MASIKKRHLLLGVAVALVATATIGWWAAHGQNASEPWQPIISDGMAWVPPGEFLMGSNNKLAQANESPEHRVKLDGFWIDTTHVTNDDFARFVDETGYITTAELKPDWETIKVQLPAGIPKPPDAAFVPGAMVFVGTTQPVPLNDYSQWWRYMPGANWRRPQGPGSTIQGKGQHPVVQVSYVDVLAYAKWVGKRLPTEAEWEYAARGGLDQATYAWGNDLQPEGQVMANYWDVNAQTFPVISPEAGGAAGTKPVKTFAPNGYGLYDMTGNAWQWVADWYDARYFQHQAKQAAQKALYNPVGPLKSFDPADPGVPVNAPKRVIRGGSFLCNESYCLSYRPSARRGSDPFSPMSHLGFRLVRDGELESSGG